MPTLVVRVVLGFAGLVGVAVGISALSKLSRDTLDSPRWLIGSIGAVSLLAGIALLAAAARRR